MTADELKEKLVFLKEPTFKTEKQIEKYNNEYNRLKEMRKPIVLCCQSGFRSRQAARILLLKGIKDVIDGGDYRVLSRKYDLPIEVI